MEKIFYFYQEMYFFPIMSNLLCDHSNLEKLEKFPGDFCRNVQFHINTIRGGRGPDVAWLP